MMDFCQGDVVKISGFRNKFVIVSKNAFIRRTNVFHVCPLMERYPDGPIHIAIAGKEGTKGTVICEQLKLIDPSARGCTRVDRLPYEQIMNVSDTVQGLFEYD